jgi:hypothetical protein
VYPRPLAPLSRQFRPGPAAGRSLLLRPLVIPVAPAAPLVADHTATVADLAEFVGAVAGVFTFGSNSAMATVQMQVGDAGVDFRVLVEDDLGVVNLSAATGIQFVFQKPDGTLLTTAGTLLDGGVDGYVHYVTAAADLDQPGTWQFQVAYVDGPQQKRTAVQKFKVKPNLPV